MIKRLPLAAKPPLTKKFLFVDGLSRSGKNLICKIISHLEQVEYFQYASIIENVIHTHALGHIDQEAAARFLQINLDEVVYNRAIGRNLNTRPSDDTSILRSTEPSAYIERSNNPDGAVAMAQFNADGRISVFHTHSALGSIGILFSAFPILKFIHSARHPIDLAEAWLRRRSEERWEDDPLVFSVAAQIEAGIVPWYAAEWAETYLAMTPTERCIECVLRLQDRDQESLDRLTSAHRRQIYQFAFEDFISDTHRIIDALAAFVDAAPHEKMPILLKDEKCP